MIVIELDVTKPESVKAAIDTYALTACLFALWHIPPGVAPSGERLNPHDQSDGQGGAY